MKKLVGILSGAALAAVLGVAGCEVDDMGSDPSEPAVVYERDYYWNGYYDGPYWYYRDHRGHYYHELREDHDRREHDHHFDRFRHHEGPSDVHAREAHHDVRSTGAGDHHEVHAGPAAAGHADGARSGGSGAGGGHAGGAGNGGHSGDGGGGGGGHSSGGGDGGGGHGGGGDGGRR